MKKTLLLWLAMIRFFCAPIPLWGAAPTQPGVFFVAGYTASGSHTDYDLARQDADAYAAANPWSGSVLVLKPTVNETCDAVALPSLGITSTTSIIGYGSGQSRIVKSSGCSAGAATLRHNDSPNGVLSRGWYQGFAVDANHIDQAACEFYGMALTTFMDVMCGNAAANADHEVEFGNHDANNYGWMDNVYLYGLATFDSSVAGQGAILTPSWNGSTLSSVQVTNPGASGYSQYARAQLVGPDTATCSSVPAFTLARNTASLISGATVTSAGSCQSTGHIYVLVQDGTPVTYGMKFTNMADSHAWILAATGSSLYGEAWLSGSANNSIYNEQPSSNQLIQISDYANGNRHINPVFINPGEYAAAIYSQNGTFSNAILSWNSRSYLAASGYFAGNDPRVFQDWVIQNSHCNNTSGLNFAPLTTRAGLLSANNPVPPGLKMQNIQNCNGTMSINWAVSEP